MPLGVRIGKPSEEGGFNGSGSNSSNSSLGNASAGSNESEGMNSSVGLNASETNASGSLNVSAAINATADEDDAERVSKVDEEAGDDLAPPHNHAEPPEKDSSRGD